MALWVVGRRLLYHVGRTQAAILYGPLIYGWARPAGLHNEDAADVTQDVFRAVSAGAPHIRHGRPGNSEKGAERSLTIAPPGGASRSGAVAVGRYIVARIRR